MNGSGSRVCWVKNLKSVVNVERRSEMNLVDAIVVEVTQEATFETPEGGVSLCG